MYFHCRWDAKADAQTGDIQVRFSVYPKVKDPRLQGGYTSGDRVEPVVVYFQASGQAWNPLSESAIDSMLRATLPRMAHDICIAINSQNGAGDEDKKLG